MEDKQRMIAERKNRLIAKLEQRNGERKDTNEDISSKSDGSDIDNLMAEVKQDLDSQIVDSEKTDRLREYLTFSANNRQAKAIQNLLEDARKQKLALNSTNKFKGFSFSKKTKATTETPEEASKPIEIPASVYTPSANENVFEEMTDETKTISGVKGTDVSLKNISSCRLQFNFEPSIVHIRNVRNSTLIFLRCDRSLLIHDCDNVHIYVAAQQVRIHTSQKLHLHVATRGAVILEDSTDIFLYPYRLKNAAGEYIEVEDNGEWRTPRDFNWLAKSPSPNWKLAAEDECSGEQFIP